MQQLLLNMPKRDAGNELNHDNWEVRISYLVGKQILNNFLKDDEEPEEAGEFKKASAEALKVRANDKNFISRNVTKCNRGEYSRKARGGT